MSDYHRVNSYMAFVNITYEYRCNMVVLPLNFLTYNSSEFRWMDLAHEFKAYSGVAYPKMLHLMKRSPYRNLLKPRSRKLSLRIMYLIYCILCYIFFIN